MDKEKNKEIMNNEDKVLFNICFSITSKNYQLQLSTKRAWVIGVFMLALRYLPKLISEAPF